MLSISPQLCGLVCCRYLVSAMAASVILTLSLIAVSALSYCMVKYFAAYKGMKYYCEAEQRKAEMDAYVPQFLHT